MYNASVIVASLCLMFAGFTAQASEKGGSNDAIRAMALNTEWLWTPHDGKVDGGKVNRGDPSPQAYQQEISFYAELITRTKTRIVALSEIENEQVVADLAKALGSTWRGYFKQGRDTATGQDVAILSDLDYVEGSVTDFGFPEGRLTGDRKGKRLSKVLGVRLKDSHGELAVLTAHLLSMRNDSKKKSLNRQRQAIAVLSALKQLQQTTQRIIMLGDFNAPRETITFDVLMSDKSLKNAELSCYLKASDQRRSLVDQVFFSGFSCLHYRRLDLGTYSDHQAVLTELLPDR